jgi:DivIVA domain-containing protein
MADSHASEPPDPPLPPDAPASEQLREVSFPIAMRGYERAAVDDFVNAVRVMVAQLEAQQTREGVVQKALDDVGVETAGILQRAHATADELTARSRAEADARVRRAENEADEVRRYADEYSEQVVVDTRLLWEERQRLIEDIRRLADEVLATADDAMERLKLPEPLAAAEAEGEQPLTGPVGVASSDPQGPADFRSGDQDAPFALGAVEDEGPFEDEPLPQDTAAYELGEVEAEPPEGETGAYEPAAFGSAEEEPPPPEEAPPATDEELGRTVELEALQGGAAEEAGEPDEPRRDDEPG